MRRYLRAQFALMCVVLAAAIASSLAGQMVDRWVLASVPAAVVFLYSVRAGRERLMWASGVTCGGFTVYAITAGWMGNAWALAPMAGYFAVQLTLVGVYLPRRLPD